MSKRVTKHARKRVRSRVGVKNANYNYRLARIKGKRINDYSGDFLKFLKYLEIKGSCKIIIYNNHIYITKSNNLITVLNMPNKYKEDSAKCIINDNVSIYS